MRNIRALSTLAVLAAVLLPAGARAASSPTWYQCVKVEKVGGHYTGGFADRNCTATLPSHEGKWELTAGVGRGKAFKGKGGHAVLHLVIPHKGDITVECASSEDRGEAAAPNRLVGVTLVLRKCKSLSAPCKSPGARKEEVTSAQLAGHLGYLGREPLNVGLWLAPEVGGESGVEAQIECQGLYAADIYGPLIGSVTGDVNTISRELQMSWAVAPYLGEPEPEYVPYTNPLSFEEPEEGAGYLSEEQTGLEPVWAGTLPVGREATVQVKGEALMIKA